MVILARGERDQYLGRLAKIGVMVSAVSLGVAGVVALVPHLISDTTWKTLYVGKIEKWLLPACLLHPGVCLGVVLTGFILNRTFTFDKIRNFDPSCFHATRNAHFLRMYSELRLARCSLVQRDHAWCWRLSIEQGDGYAASGLSNWTCLWSQRTSRGRVAYLAPKTRREERWSQLISFTLFPISWVRNNRFTSHGHF